VAILTDFRGGREEDSDMLTITAPEELVRFGPGGGNYRIVTQAAETGGLLFAMEVTELPGGGPPLHVHSAEDEYFTVLDGEFTFHLDGQARTVGAGGAVFAPRGIPHAFKNCSDRSARMLAIATPGQIGAFFDYGLGVGPDGRERPSDELMIQRIMQLAPQFGLRVLGPSPL
jgi:quercetin dioxygenase-like cupin family protein